MYDVTLKYKCGIYIYGLALFSNVADILCKLRIYICYKTWKKKTEDNAFHSKDQNS